MLSELSGTSTADDTPGEEPRATAAGYSQLPALPTTGQECLLVSFLLSVSFLKIIFVTLLQEIGSTHSSLSPRGLATVGLPRVALELEISLSLAPQCSDHKQGHQAQLTVDIFFSHIGF